MDDSRTAEPAIWRSEPLRLNSLGRPRAGVIWSDLHAEGLDAEAVIASRRAQALEELSRVAGNVVVAVCLPRPQEVPHVFFEMRNTLLLDRYRLELGGVEHEALRAAVEAQDPDARIQFDFHSSFALDGRVDALWATNAKLELLSPVRDRAGLTSRYAERPGREHRFLASELFGQLFALAVCREDGPNVWMLELMSRDKHVMTGMELCLCIADHYRAEGRRSLLFVGQDAYYFRSVLRHFERRPDPEHPFFTRAADPATAHIFENGINWTVTLGDALDR